MSVTLKYVSPRQEYIVVVGQIERSGPLRARGRVEMAERHRERSHKGAVDVSALAGHVNVRDVRLGSEPGGHTAKLHEHQIIYCYFINKCCECSVECVSCR